MRIVFGIILFFILVIPVITSDSFSVELGGSSSREDDGRIPNSNVTKVDPKIIEWQNSPNPSQFAINNNISYDNNKIAIFIHLDDSNSISNIPSQIEITGSDQNIVVAKVSSEEINQLALLDFVQQITLPVLVGIHSDTLGGTVELSDPFPREEDPTVTYSNVTKVDPKIIEWQNSPNPNQFAINNNISYDNNKIAIFIHLDDSNSISNIPSQIEITGSDQNIVVAKVSSEEINQLALLDFVQQITLPVLVEPPPIPSTTKNDVDYSTILIIGVIIGIIVIVSVVIKLGVQRRKVYS